MAFLSQEQLLLLGFKALGTGVLLSDKASIHNASAVEIGDNARIDDFCILSAGRGGICIGRNVHVAAYSSLIGAGRIVLGDFSNLSSRVAVYSSNDDYSGDTMTNPTIPSQYKNVTDAPVTIEKHVIVGAGAVILPGVRLFEGSCIGALSLVKKDCAAFGIYCGTPAKMVGERRRGLLEKERCYVQSETNTEVK